MAHLSDDGCFQVASLAAVSSRESVSIEISKHMVRKAIHVWFMRIYLLAGRFHQRVKISTRHWKEALCVLRSWDLFSAVCEIGRRCGDKGGSGKAPYKRWLWVEVWITREEAVMEKLGQGRAKAFQAKRTAVQRPWGRHALGLLENRKGPHVSGTEQAWGHVA